jgi:glycosyltransferase involved in cell wall biosynthesis
MPKARALCILSTRLGNNATARRLIEALKKTDQVEPEFVLLTEEDFARHPAPRWARLSDPWEAQYVARQKVQPGKQGQFDILLVNSWEYVIAFQELARKIPAAALFDAVPATIDAQLRRRGHGGWKREMIASYVHHRAFRRAAPDFRMFLPMGSDSAEALVSDYGIDRDNCVVTLAPQDLELWKPGPRSSSPQMRLLFVTNDFARKGGEFLLRLYADHLADSCTLTIASNDPALDGRSLPPGAVWRRGCNREELLGIYRESDLFLFPTRQDYMPQVLAEALAVGVPCMASDVGGIRDLVLDGINGFLMPYDSAADTGAARIRQLRSDPSELTRLAMGARAFALEKLGMQRFENMISSVVDRLVASRIGAGSPDGRNRPGVVSPRE